FFDTDDMHGNMASSRIVLQTIENGPTVAIRQSNVQGDGRRVVFVGQRQSNVPHVRDQTLESFFVREIQQDAGKGRVVFDDQHYAIALFDFHAIVDHRRWIVDQ